MAARSGFQERNDYQVSLSENFFYDQIINSSRSMISIINRDYLYEKVNITFCNAHNTSPHEMAGKSLADIWGNEVFINVLKKNIDACFSGRIIRYEACFPTSHLSKRFFEVIFRPIKDETGKITHVMAETADINELWQSRKELTEIGEQLITLERRLMQAQKLETIGALAGGIAHDFNNILATISGYSEMLMEDLPKGCDQAEKVAKIQLALVKARSIINQILTFSRQIDQEKVVVSASEVLLETIGFMKSSVPASISLKCRTSAREDYVFADPTQLFRVYLNLMTNAIQAMEECGGILSVRTEICRADNLRHQLTKDIVADEYVLMTFRDTGKGMDESHVSRIFEPFFTTREVGKGTGLGLSVIHGIVSELEGEIIVSSKKNKGSVFYVYLPVTRSLQAPRRRKTHKRILFITGNKYESNILSMALKRKGYEIVYISDSLSLTKRLTGNKEIPDLIIYMADSELIHKDDLAMLYDTRKISVPCILIIEPEQDLSGEKLLNSGIIVQQLLKPVSLKEITDAIQISLNN